MQKMKPQRLAILIVAPGNTGKYKQGFYRDIERMRCHLLSARGGHWRNDEIIILENPGWSEVQAVLDQAQSDYLFIYFSGHGWQDETTAERYLIINNEQSVPDYFIRNESPRILFIADCCRTIEYAAISGIPEQEYFNFIEEESIPRKMFDDFILRSPAGYMIIHAAQAGQTAFGQVDGGRFTKSLLEAASRTNTAIRYGVLYIQNLLEMIEISPEKLDEIQYPEIVYASGNLTVPFAIDVPVSSNTPKAVPGSSKPRLVRRVIQRPVVDNNSNALLLIGGLAAVVLIATNYE